MKNVKTSVLLLFLMVATVFLLSNCVTTKPLEISHEIYQGYMPIEPIPTKTIEFYDIENDRFTRKPWEALSDSLKRNLLPIQSSQVSMRKVDATGNVTFMPASISAETGTYEVIMDYMKYRIEDVNAGSLYLGSGRVGIGLRIKASVVTNKTDLNLSGLGKLGLEASMNNLSGFLSVDVVGVDSKDITNLIPLSAKLDETSIQYALQALATIKSKIWNDDVKLTPHIIAVNQEEKGSEQLIKESVANVSVFDYTKSSEIIRNFWMPDKGKPNKENEAKLNEWLGNNNLENTPGKLTVFIYAKDKETERQKMIRDLKLK